MQNHVNMRKSAVADARGAVLDKRRGCRLEAVGFRNGCNAGRIGAQCAVLDKKGRLEAGGLRLQERARRGIAARCAIFYTAAGRVNAAVASQDYRLNVLRIHDDRNNASQMYKDALANFGYNAAGLYATVTTDGKPILCAKCHLSNALGTPGFGTICTLTNALHGHHAAVIDPTTNASMDASTNRSAAKPATAPRTPSTPAANATTTSSPSCCRVTQARLRIALPVTRTPP